MTYALRAKIMEYEEGKPWVTPSEAFVPPLGIREGKQLSEGWEYTVTWVHTAGFPAVLFPREGRVGGID